MFANSVSEGTMCYLHSVIIFTGELKNRNEQLKGLQAR